MWTQNTGDVIPVRTMRVRELACGNVWDEMATVFRLFVQMAAHRPPP